MDITLVTSVLKEALALLSYLTQTKAVNTLQRNIPKYSKNMILKSLWMEKAELQIIFVLRGSGEV